MSYLKNRSVVTTILLSIFTCGIYFYIWLYQNSQEINNTTGDTSENAALEVVLCIVTCGLYTFYWFYKYCRKLTALAQRVGAPADDNALACILLSVFGLMIVSVGIMQAQINLLADGFNQAPQA